MTPTDQVAEWITIDARAKYGNLLDDFLSPLRSAECIIGFAHRAAAAAGSGVVSHEDIVQDLAVIVLESSHRMMGTQYRDLFSRILRMQPDKSIPGLPAQILTEDSLDTMIDLAYIVGDEAIGILEMHIVQGGTYDGIAKELGKTVAQVKRIAAVAIAKIRTRGEGDGTDRDNLRDGEG